MPDFTCRKCNEYFEAEWTFGDEVTCPACGTRWETDYDISINADGDEFIHGPWLEGEVSEEE